VNPRIESKWFHSVEKSLKWQEDCLNVELVELMNQAEMVCLNYRRMAIISNILTVEPMLQKCKLLLKLGLQKRVKFHVPEIGEFVWEYGLEACNAGYSSLHVVLLEDILDLRDKKWDSWRNISSCIFLECATILLHLGSLEEDVVNLGDCRCVLNSKWQRFDSK
jgi:hypothetical protein